MTAQFGVQLIPGRLMMKYIKYIDFLREFFMLGPELASTRRVKEPRGKISRSQHVK